MISLMHVVGIEFDKFSPKPKIHLTKKVFRSNKTHFDESVIIFNPTNIANSNVSFDSGVHN